MIAKFSKVACLGVIGVAILFLFVAWGFVYFEFDRPMKAERRAFFAATNNPQALGRIVETVQPLFPRFISLDQFDGQDEDALAKKACMDSSLRICASRLKQSRPYQRD